MPENEATEPSIGDLRAMLTAEPAAADPETPAPAAQAEGEPAPASEPVVNEGAERGPDGKFKAAQTAAEVQDGVAKRIGKALEAQRKAEQRAADLEAELQQAKSGSQPAKEPAPPTAAAEAPKKPELKDCDSYEEFNEKLLDWKLEQSRLADARAANERTAAEQEAATTRAWNDRVAKVAKDVHTDYEDVIAEAAEMPISPAMNRTIFESERGPELAYFLAKNPEQTARIAKLGPLAAARELGKIEASFAAPAAAPLKPAGKPLPKPASAVGGSASPHVVDLNDPKIDMKMFKAEFSKRLSPR